MTTLKPVDVVNSPEFTQALQDAVKVKFEELEKKLKLETDKIQGFETKLQELETNLKNETDKIGGFDAKIDAKTGGFDAKIDTKTGALKKEIKKTQDTILDEVSKILNKDFVKNKSLDGLKDDIFVAIGVKEEGSSEKPKKVILEDEDFSTLIDEVNAANEFIKNLNDFCNSKSKGLTFQDSFEKLIKDFYNKQFEEKQRDEKKKSKQLQNAKETPRSSWRSKLRASSKKSCSSKSSGKDDSGNDDSELSVAERLRKKLLD